ncbi:MAG: ion transporter [Helicobacteraceae bacterium]|nr:ion transporter [Helicobacteraceae bacterium]
MNGFIAFCAKVHTDRFRWFFMGVIVFNAVILGLETYPAVRAGYGEILTILDHICLAIFTIEILMKLVVDRHRFFFSGWNIFDFLIVAVSFIPGEGTVSIFRALRIFRMLTLFNKVKKLKMVVSAILKALPSISGVAILLLIIFYIFAVLCTTLFGEKFPEFFGTLQGSMLTLFQILTLDSWMSGITRSVLKEFPNAYLVFVPYVLITSFIVLNAFIGIIVNSLGEESKEESDDDYKKEFAKLNERLANIERALEARDKKPSD